MAKYSYEFKKEVVNAYLSGEGGDLFLCQKYSISDTKVLRTWVCAYHSSGDKGLLRSRKKKRYAFEYKLHVVELYLSSEVSYQELAFQEGINNSALICKWVNDFQIAGPDALRPKKKGRKKTLGLPDDKKVKTKCSAEQAPVDANNEQVKELKDELLKLRIENAYLKELRRLRLEEEALLKKQRESSTASEETSN